MKPWPKLQKYAYDNELTDNIDLLLGKIIVRIEKKYSVDTTNQGIEGIHTIVFTFDSGHVVEMYHYPDCCSTAEIKEIVGDLTDLIGVPLLEAECVSNKDDPADGLELSDSYTWTYYKFGTKKGFVTIDWLGVSNGYYNEEVDLFLTKEPTE